MQCRERLKERGEAAVQRARDRLVGKAALSSLRMDQFLRMREVSLLTGVPRSTLYLLISRGDFPRPVALTRRLVAWKASEVEAWMAARSVAA
jgi:prophage regulatory protein